MAGFVDVLLRGVMLVGAAIALGGLTFVVVVLRGAPDARTRRSLTLAAAGAAAVALAQLAVALVTLGSLSHGLGAAAVVPFSQTAFALAAAARVMLGLATALGAMALARGGRGPALVLATLAGAALLVASSASLSHAMARLDHRGWLLTLDAAHQLAAAIWVGGLAHLLVAMGGDPSGAPAAVVARRFSTLALLSVSVLVAAGALLSVGYVGDPGALVQTAYGVMVLTKLALLAAILWLAAANFRLVRRMTSAVPVQLARAVEVELGLAVTVLFAAASLTSLPPAVDVRDDRASLAEVGARFAAVPPRLASPEIGELLRQTNPLAGGPETRLEIEREWSEFNHHWAGLFVLAMGLLAVAHRAGVRVARHWPLLLIGLGLFLFVRNDPEVWPLGPIGFWASLAEPEILQHRAFMTLVMLFGAFEWAVRAELLAPRPWAYVFPLICAVGGGLLLTHSHAVFNVKEAFLMEVTHAPIGVLGAFAGWARWLELRLPEAGPVAGRVWPACLTAVGLLLLVYSES